jgi:hypothetical protein
MYPSRRASMLKTAGLVVAAMSLGMAAGHLGVVSLLRDSARLTVPFFLLLAAYVVAGSGLSATATVLLDSRRPLRSGWFHLMLIATVLASGYITWVTLRSSRAPDPVPPDVAPQTRSQPGR